MNKEQELIDTFIAIGCLFGNAEKIASICLSEMEREAVGFAEFCGKHSIRYDAVDDVWLYFDKTGRYNYTTAQLYQLYKAKVNE